MSAPAPAPGAAPEPALYTVAVRELCEFTAKQGDLDLRFTPAPTAQEGVAGHGTVVARRGAGYQAEVSLSGLYQGRLRVRGRADGLDPSGPRLEEIKTHKGPLERQNPGQRALHWAQALVYGWLYCQQEGLSELTLALVYFEVGSQQETVFTRQLSATELQAHFEAQCARFLSWAEQQLAHRQARDAALQALRFPFADFRTGQRPLAEAVYRGASAGLCVLAQAPTGIGKTLGTLFPLLKAAPAQGLDKVFFLAAKTSGRQLALHALEQLAPQQTLPLRVLELVARDKACEHPDRACHGESCPLAQGFYDRLPAARQDALSGPAPQAQGPWRLDQAQVRAVALRHQVCPYYLSQELARWVDLVVGDYNYYFDASALLWGLSQANSWRVALLVDEAHNLVDRARQMYSAELRPEALALARRGDTAQRFATVKKGLNQLRRQWLALDKAQPQPYAVYPQLPDKLLHALQQCSQVLGTHQAEHPTEFDPALRQFYFDVLQACRLAESLDTHSLFDVSQPSPPEPGRSRLCLRNLVPAPFLAPRWAGAHSSTLFSATLQPPSYHAQLLGLPEAHRTLEVESPFDAAQLQVHTARHLSTRYADRAASLAPLVDLMAAQYRAQPGNYLAFFSSYDYLQQVADQLAQSHPDLPCWRQSRRMLEAEQQAFLARFSETSQGIGLAVLGGAFAEGIDLPGRRLIGAFVATLGLPQVNPVNEQVRQRLQALFGAGYDYTYLYPGLQKVVQAAGRVIRGPGDRGVVHLMDDRFARPEVRQLLPRWWALD
ncbi:ATP-dependent DNA helicase [Curvibacter sp. HBC61]|uniref:ATP-dependent DNA helicase n=1 Tax=Curvibacter cyanobacteriorum TaxID=3026422 RepID=A0ABT5N385_9BURK|nr:ATP-dependent DNA helicase [Curvibacter sp. HBC61]MDD0839527.1 ATP-dependent DNA helicase [Curvibacter sp. HBC61]